MRCLPGIAQQVGHSCADLFPDHGGLADAVHRQGAVTQQVWLSVEGEERMFEVRVHPLTYQRTRRARGHLAVLYDITEEHRLAAERDGLLDDLRGAMDKVQELGRLLPICANCKKIRDDHGYWHNLESFLQDHSEVEIALATCPECRARLSKQRDLADVAVGISSATASATQSLGGRPLAQPSASAD